jgi:hypothetical protein
MADETCSSVSAMSADSLERRFERRGAIYRVRAREATEVPLKSSRASVKDSQRHMFVDLPQHTNECGTKSQKCWDESTKKRTEVDMGTGMCCSVESLELR